MSKLAVVVSHPIPHFAPWHREVERAGRIRQRVLFCSDWGVGEKADADFGTTFKWDVPLTEGYEHEFLALRRPARRLSFREIDNPSVALALDRFDPDVVQVFGYAYRTNWRAVAWARRRGRPVLLYSDSNLNARRAAWKSVLREPVVRSFYRRVDGALAIGDNNRAYHLRYGLPEERVFPGVCPIDRARLLAAVPEPAAARARVRGAHGIPGDAFVVIACGKYVARKRMADVASAVATLEARGIPAWAMLVGEGPDRPALERLIAQTGTRRVVLTGFVNQSRIPAYFAAADVLAVPSEFDPHPLVVAEGASFGLPVVASDQLGCIGEHDSAQPGRNTLVFPCGDREALAGSIASLHADGALRARMSAASTAISEWQDARVAAEALARATDSLHRLGPR